MPLIGPRPQAISFQQARAGLRGVSLSPGAAPPSPWRRAKHTVLVPAIRGLFTEDEAEAVVAVVAVVAVGGVVVEAAGDTADVRVVVPTATP